MVDNLIGQMKDTRTVATNAYNRQNDHFTKADMCDCIVTQGQFIDHYHSNSGEHRFGFLNGGQATKKVGRLQYLCVSNYLGFLKQLAEVQSQRAQGAEGAHPTFVNEYGNHKGENVAPLFLDLDWKIPYGDAQFDRIKKTFDHPALKKDIFDDVVRVVVSVLDQYIDSTDPEDTRRYWKFTVTCPNRLRFYADGIKFGGHVRAEQRKNELGESVGGPLLSKEHLRRMAMLIAEALTKDKRIGHVLDWLQVVDPAPLAAQGMRLPREFKGKETKPERFCEKCYPLWVAQGSEMEDAVRLKNARTYASGCWCNETQIGLRKKVHHVPTRCYSYQDRDEERLQELSGTSTDHMLRTLTRLSIWTRFLTQEEADQQHNGGKFQLNKQKLTQDMEELQEALALTKKTVHIKQERTCGANTDGDGVAIKIKKPTGSKKRKFPAEPGVKQAVEWQEKPMTTEQRAQLGTFVRLLFPHYKEEVDAGMLSCPPGGKIYRLTLKGNGRTRCLNKPSVDGDIKHAEGNPTYIIITANGLTQRCRSPNAASECRTMKCLHFKSDVRGWYRHDLTERRLAAKLVMWLYPGATQMPKFKRVFEGYQPEYHAPVANPGFRRKPKRRCPPSFNSNKT